MALPKPATKPVKKPSDAIENALIVIDTLGWTKNTLQNGEGAVCLMGAAELGVANHGYRRVSSAMKYTGGKTALSMIRRKTIKYITDSIAKGVARRRKIALAKAEFIIRPGYSAQRSIPSYNDGLAKDVLEVKEVLRAAQKAALANGE